MKLACTFGFHDWYIDCDDGASGHSMDEAIAFLYADLLRCSDCPKTQWMPKDGAGDIPRRTAVSAGTDR